MRRVAYYQGKMSRYEQFHISLCTLIISFILPAVVIAIAFNSKSDNTALYLAEHKQLVDDWMSRPYVDIILKNTEEGCPIDYEPLLWRHWNGTHDVCDGVDGLSVHDP